MGQVKAQRASETMFPDDSIFSRPKPYKKIVSLDQK